MLKEINKMKLFFEDCYRDISVREYSRETTISPPTASKILKGFAKDGLLKMREERGFLLFKVNRESKIMKELSCIYWQEELKELLEFLEKDIFSKTIILFGSLSKLEASKESDIDLAIFGSIKKSVDLKNFEKKLKREIHPLFYESLEKVNKELKLNIINGYVLGGYLS